MTGAEAELTKGETSRILGWLGLTTGTGGVRGGLTGAEGYLGGGWDCSEDVEVARRCLNCSEVLEEVAGRVSVTPWGGV